MRLAASSSRWDFKNRTLRIKSFQGQLTHRVNLFSISSDLTLMNEVVKSRYCFMATMCFMLGKVYFIQSKLMAKKCRKLYR